jgi:hypothetical protein
MGRGLPDKRRPDSQSTRGGTGESAPAAGPFFVNRLLQLLIPKPALFRAERIGSFFGNREAQDDTKALELMSDTSILFADINPLLVICYEAGFLDGVIALLRRDRRNSDLAALYVSRHMTSELVAWITEQPDLPSDDWLMILRYFVGQDPTCPPKKLEFHRPRPRSLPKVTMPWHQKAAAAAPAQPLDVERAR